MRAAEPVLEFGIASVLDFVSTRHVLVKFAISLNGAVGQLTYWAHRCPLGGSGNEG